MQEEPAPRQDFTAMYAQARANIDKTSYCQGRGISKATVDRFGIGYLENLDGAGGYVVIPITKYAYQARRVDGGNPRFKRPRGVPVELFNADALKTAKEAVCVVEGEFDALSLEEIGYPAVALGSTSNVGKFLELVEKVKPTATIIVCPDNDEPGRKAGKELMKGLEAKGIKCSLADPTKLWLGKKDANEALLADPEAFEYEVAGAVSAEERYARTAVASKLTDIRQGIADSASAKRVLTGFPTLDKLLDGGLYPGLYVLGAGTSMGKSSLVGQMADNMAKQGHDVLLFSMEMSEPQLACRSVSRITFELAKAQYADYDLAKECSEHSPSPYNDRINARAKTAMDILDGRRYKGYKKYDTDLIDTAFAEYAKLGEHVFITTGILDLDIGKITNAIENHMSLRRRKPVVIVDYLQIVAPGEGQERATEKQVVDKTVSDLKRISSQYGLVVFALSSLNRESYDSDISESAFKESGGIETTADCLLGLQFSAQTPKSGESKPTFDRSSEEREDPRRMQIKLLKSRFGIRGLRVNFAYKSRFNYFEDIGFDPSCQGFVNRLESAGGVLYQGDDVTKGSSYT